MHALWFLLDIPIFVLNVRVLSTVGKRCAYVLFTGLTTAAVALVFSVPTLDGMLISVFAIDLVMAVCFVARAKNVSRHGKISVAILKLAGDLFAWLAYAQSSAFVGVAGFVVLALNLFYLSWCLEESFAEEMKCIAMCCKEYKQVNSL